MKKQITNNKKICPLWKKLPNHNCSECPNANEDCIMIGE